MLLSDMRPNNVLLLLDLVAKIGTLSATTTTTTSMQWNGAAGFWILAAWRDFLEWAALASIDRRNLIKSKALSHE